MADVFEESIKQLKSIVNDGERCANQIFDAVDKLNKVLRVADVKTAEKAGEQVARIIEACHFQDFSGQRASKIIAHLNHAKSKVGAIETKELTDSEALLQGPAAETANQADIDKLFENA